MANNILTAKIATVKIGLLEIEGLLFSDGTFGVAIPQLAEINLIPKKLSQKQLKALLCTSFQIQNVELTLFKAKTKLHPKAVNCTDLDGLLLIIKAGARQGNQTALIMTDSLIGVMLHQLFCDSFGIVFDAEDRQA